MNSDSQPEPLEHEHTPEAIAKRFRDAWRDRVVRILADGGKQTVHEV